ncbi:hypothetical protein AMTR_s00082p00087140 [Amborella trichopoda]|uniref:Uncharacterized protein n=1 Tax=Amborella trichopoda TaxID=13333 RepID=W1NSS2_AMBTC|nr:hypothetical protein AMTR_s00082p00087140 [Amborella trichopoda]
MEYGVELSKAIHHLIGRSSFGELVQLHEFLGTTAANLTTFGVPKAYQLKGITGELALMAEEILKLEKLVSPMLNPSIGPLLDFFSNQPSIFCYVEGLSKEFKRDWAYWERFCPTLKAHSLKEGEYAALGGISFRDNEANIPVLRHHC